MKQVRAKAAKSPSITDGARRILRALSVLLPNKTDAERIEVVEMELRGFVHAIIEEEREACAKIAESVIEMVDEDASPTFTALTAADMIRG